MFTDGCVGQKRSGSQRARLHWEGTGHAAIVLLKANMWPKQGCMHRQGQFIASRGQRVLQTSVAQSSMPRRTAGCSTR
eukprot:352281-Chlamydomonas_euryale.AAC.12